MTEDSIAPAIFDRLRKATAADPAELVSLYRDYLAEARQTLLQLRSAWAEKDAEKLRDRAHYLRGSSLIMGTTAMARYCASLELMGRNAEFRDTAVLLDQTSAALNAVEAELIKQLGPTVLPVEGSAT
jgi:HPt (histidine-containing phosphotransfer) domain-containing protein